MDASLERGSFDRWKKNLPLDNGEGREEKEYDPELFDLCFGIRVVGGFGAGVGAVLGDLQGREKGRRWRSRGCLEVCRAEHNVSNESSNSN